MICFLGYGDAGGDMDEDGDVNGDGYEDTVLGYIRIGIWTMWMRMCMGMGMGMGME